MSLSVTVGLRLPPAPPVRHSSPSSFSSVSWSIPAARGAPGSGLAHVADDRHEEQGRSHPRTMGPALDCGRCRPAGPVPALDCGACRPTGPVPATIPVGRPHGRALRGGRAFCVRRRPSNPGPLAPALPAFLGRPMNRTGASEPLGAEVSRVTSRTVHGRRSAEKVFSVRRETASRKNG
jgi:hypothetical protein